jgi:acyl-CoA thioester hydrolase
VTEYSLPIVPRYAEVDLQAVVFNAHYLTWFDEAITGFFDHLGATYPDLMDAGLDMQLVHTEIDYAAPVRWRDIVRVAVACEGVGSTSFTIIFSVLRRRDESDEVLAVRARSVYVVVSTEDWAKRPVPDALRAALASAT